MRGRGLTIAAAFAAFACDDGSGLRQLTRDLAVQPSPIDFGEVPFGRTTRMTVTLRAAGSGVVTILAPEIGPSLGGVLSFEGTLPPALGPSVGATLAAALRPAAEGPINGSVIFPSDAEETPRLEVQVLATAVRPPLEATPLEVDFGRVVIGDERTERITLINTTERPMTLTGAAPEPGTSAEFDAPLPAMAVIAPRSILEVSLRYRPGDLGVDRGALEIRGDLPHATVSIAVTGEGVSSEIEVEPAALNFSVTEGQQRIQSFVVRNRGSRPHQVTRIEIEPGASSAFQPVPASIGALPFTLAPEEARQIDVAYAPVRSGEDSGAIAVASTGIARPGTARVLLTGRAEGPPAPDLAVDPSAIEFGAVRVGTEAARELVLRSAGRAPLALSAPPAIEPAGAPYQLLGLPPLALPAGEVRPVAVVFRPTAIGPAPAAAVVIRSNDPDEPEVRVPLSGAGTDLATPSIVVEPDPVQLGRVPRGTSSARSVRVRNLGSADLTVSSLAVVTSAAGRFTLGAPPSMPLVVPARALSAPFTIGYADTGPPGAHAGALEILSDDPLQPVKRVALLAETVPPRVGDLDLRIVLNWDTSDTDVDVHLIRPGGQWFDRTADACYCNTQPDWGVAGEIDDDPFVDLDDIDGGGPETVDLPRAETGSYAVAVHYYADRGHGPTEATVRIESRGMVLASASQRLADGDRWDVGTVAWDAAARTGTFSLAGTVAPSEVSLCR